MEYISEEIIKHAKLNRQNMEAALQVGLVFGDLRKTLIRDFANYFKECCAGTSLSTIDVSGWRDRPTGAWTGMSYKEDNWLPHCMIKVEARIGGIKQFIFGIHTGDPNTRDHIDESHKKKIYETLNNECGQGKQDDYWAWYQDVDDNYRNFNNFDTLIKLYDKSKMAEYYLEKLSGLKDAIEKKLLLALE